MGPVLVFEPVLVLESGLEPIWILTELSFLVDPLLAESNTDCVNWVYVSGGSDFTLLVLDVAGPWSTFFDLDLVLVDDLSAFLWLKFLTKPLVAEFLLL